METLQTSHNKNTCLFTQVKMSWKLGVTIVRVPTQTMHYYKGNPWKSLKIAIHLHCLVPPKMNNFNDPWISQKFPTGSMFHLCESALSSRGQVITTYIIRKKPAKCSRVPKKQQAQKTGFLMVFERAIHPGKLKGTS